MFIKLLLAFTIIPLLELALLIKIGEYIGLIPTILLVGLTGVLGVSLARSQGFIVVRKIKESLQQGKMPADDLLAGLLILIGGTMLLTPGLLTDLTGFSLIIPFTRGYYTGFIKKRFVNYLRKNNINYSNGFNKGDDDYIDIEVEKEK
ncbi:MAG: FxsA family protein [Firmicutes bacterium]|nr:FxsA family protein [Bacillota bacterium]